MNSRSYFPRTEDRDKNPRISDQTDSVGIFLRKMGSEYCWEATGKVRETWKDLSKEILNQLGGPSEPGDPIVAWCIVMIGKTKSTAIPTLLFNSKQRSARKSIKSQVVESGILNRYPAIRVGDCSEPPDFGRLVPLNGLQDGKANHIQLLAGNQGDLASSLHQDEDRDKAVFIRPTHLLSGSRIFGPNMRTATAGAVFRIHGRQFVTTVGHLFTVQDETEAADTDSDSEFEFEIPGVECPKSSSEPGASESNARLISPTSPTRGKETSKDALTKLGSVIFSATEAGNPGLDFSLIEIGGGCSENTASSDSATSAGLPHYASLKSHVVLEPADVYVKAITGSNHILQGRLTGTPTFIRCPGGVGFQEVWSVRFNGPLNQGDCGSLVTGLDGEMIYGHIIAGSTVSRVAYIVPTNQIFKCLDSYLMPKVSGNISTAASCERDILGIGTSTHSDADRLPTPPYEKNILHYDISPQRAPKRLLTPLHEQELLNNIISPQISTNSDDTTPCKEEMMENGWPRIFSTYRDPLYDPPLANNIHTIEDSTALISWTSSQSENEVLRDFLHGTTSRDVENGIGSAGWRQAARIDDRNSPNLEGSGVSRQCRNWITATGLHRYLSEPRFNHWHEPDASRRLIYIADLSPAFVHALAETTSVHQAPALSSAICKHLSLEASIAVKIPLHGFPIFQLEFHLPFFALDRSSFTPDSAGRPWGKVHTIPGRRCTDLSFLLGDTSSGLEPNLNQPWTIREQQISLVVTGTDDWRWVGYCFKDSGLDGEPYNYQSFDDDGEYLFDPATNEESDYNMPIWRPREYFLTVFQIQIAVVRKSWEYLIFKVERSVNQYMRENSTNFSCGSQNPRERATEIKKAIEWCIKTRELLQELNANLSQTLHTWKTFSAPNGDIRYLHGHDDATAISREARRSLSSVKATFKQLEMDQHKLVLLVASFSDFSLSLQLRLNLEGTQSTQNTEFTSNFLTWVLYPISLAVAILSMEPSFLPFNMTGTWFFIILVLLMALMSVIHATMRYFSRLQNQVATWRKICQLEAGGRQRLEHEYRQQFAPMASVYSNTITRDEKNER